MITSQKTKLQSPEVLALQSQLTENKNVFFVSSDFEGFYKTTGDFIDYVYDAANAFNSQIKINAFLRSLELWAITCLISFLLHKGSF